MDVQVWQIERIKPYPKNARKIPQAAVDAVALSLREFGWQQPIVVDQAGVIIVGHVRRLAAIANGWTEAPVVLFQGTAAQARQYRLMDNRSHDEAKWDEDVLTAELLDMRGLELDLSLTGFSTGELDRLLGPTAGLTDPDDAPPVPIAPVSRLGDLWLCGPHRVLCGDATIPENFARLCIDLAACLWTDPPFGVKYVGKTRDALTIQGDDDGAGALLAESLCAIGPHIESGAPFYIAHPPGGRFVVFGNVVDAIGWRLHQSLVWVKDSMVLGHSDYHFRHEPILYGFTPGDGRPGRGKHVGSRWYGDHAQTSVIEVTRPKRSLQHPTMKPVELVQHCLANSCPREGIVLDCFAGSGSTLIAADITGRICYGLEISPAYVDVIVQRWQNFTGNEATLDGHGATFAHVRDGRIMEAEDAIKEGVLEARP